MKIRKIIIENNPILGDVNLDFTNSEGIIYDTVIFVGENGLGKSTLMNIIYSFSLFEDPKLNVSEKRTIEFEIELGTNKILNGVYRFEVDEEFNNQIYTNWMRHMKIFLGDKNVFQDFVGDPERNNLIKMIFSDVSINFNAEISSTTNKTIDVDVKQSLKSSENVAREITQMLVDIYREDSGELNERVKSHIGQFPPDDVIEKRTKRFQKAFNIIFEDKDLKYEKVENLKPIFTKNGANIEINNLSTGEKQIVFRGGFLLKDKNSIHGAVSLVDEPEISMHPLRQKKILEFYKNLFTAETGRQTSQIFISTHSPYLLQSIDNKMDGIFVFPGCQKVDNIRKYIGALPSLGVINYHAFNLPSVELHDELYGYIQRETNSFTQDKLEEYFLSKGFVQGRDWIDHGKTISVTLQTFIRNKLHHPEIKAIEELKFTYDELKQSIDEMIDLINRESL